MSWSSHRFDGHFRWSWKMPTMWLRSMGRWVDGSMDGSHVFPLWNDMHPGRLTAGTYSHPPFRKENALPHPYDYVQNVNLPGCGQPKKARGNHFPCEVVFWLVGWLFFVVFWLLRGQKFVVEPLKVPMNGPLWLGRWFDRWMQPAVLLRGNSLQSRPWERGEGSQEAQDWRPIFSHLKNLGMQLVYKINLVVSAIKGFRLKDDFNRIFWNLEDDGKEIFDYCNYYLTFSTTVPLIEAGVEEEPKPLIQLSYLGCKSLMF